MAKKNKKSKKIDDDTPLTADDVVIHDIRKFQWSEDDVNGLVWLDDHEYTGTVPPSS